MKKRTVFTIIFVAIVACAIAAGFYYMQKSKPEPKSFSYELKDDEFFANAQTIDTKLYSSDIKGVFYSLNPTKYYFVENGKATPIKPAGTIKTTVSDSAFKFAFTIPYINYKGERFGVGEWKKEGAQIYDYAFAVLRKMPKALGSDYENLLLIDTHDNSLSATDREYSEAFILNKSGDSGGQLLDMRNRTPDKSGKMRTDWFVYTLEGIKRGYYFSARDYSQDEQNPTYDLYKARSGEDKKIAGKVNSSRLLFATDKVYYFKQGKDSFSVMRVQKGVHSKAATLKGKISEYKIKGAYALKDMKLINLYDGEITPLNLKKVYDFSYSESALVVAGKEENREGEKFKVQKLMYLSSEKTAVFYANNIMSEHSVCEFVNNSVITEKDGKTNIINSELI